MQGTNVNLLDPDQEPTDEQLGDLMHCVGNVVRTRAAEARRKLAEQVERDLPETGGDKDLNPARLATGM